MAQEDFAKLLDVKDVLPYFKVSENTFRSWIRRGQLPSALIVKIGNTVKIRSVILIKYLNGDL